MIESYEAAEAYSKKAEETSDLGTDADLEGEELSQTLLHRVSKIPARFNEQEAGCSQPAPKISSRAKPATKQTPLVTNSKAPTVPPALSNFRYQLQGILMISAIIKLFTTSLFLKCCLLWLITWDMKIIVKFG